eukprot:CAMPEP_0197118712 /NCGR_PEP_ID=MMETSP1390-20130617/1769_1 /TAXON_ID=38833 /ORGANISM="Micromonas sp., Strain CCMP2099" /LENGTH=36 /DNA_ID= /DNA_START= /DNA_END= /DNA_ORIENTATION=
MGTRRSGRRFANWNGDPPILKSSALALCTGHFEPPA